jgi:hypothetical protein
MGGRIVTVYRVPLIPEPQRFQILLDGVAVTLVVRWNDAAGVWMLDIFDDSGTVPLVLALPLVPGENLLAQYRHMGIPGELRILTDGAPYDAPTLANLGGAGNLYYVAV